MVWGLGVFRLSCDDLGGLSVLMQHDKAFSDDGIFWLVTRIGLAGAFLMMLG